MLRLGSRNHFQIARCIQQNASRNFSQAVASLASTSSSSSLVETSIDGNIATLTMNRLPVNSLSLEMYVYKLQSNISLLILMMIRFLKV